MFRKLLLRLTLLNAGVIAILFCLLIAGAYFVPERDLHRRAEFFLSRLAAEINAGHRPPMLHRPHPDGPGTVFGEHPSPPPEFPAGPPPPPGLPLEPMKGDDFPQPPVIFYVKLATDGSIAATSASVPYSTAELAELVKKLVGKPTAAARFPLPTPHIFICGRSGKTRRVSCCYSRILTGSRKFFAL